MGISSEKLLLRFVNFCHSFVIQGPTKYAHMELIDGSGHKGTRTRSFTWLLIAFRGGIYTLVYALVMPEIWHTTSGAIHVCYC